MTPDLSASARKIPILLFVCAFACALAACGDEPQEPAEEAPPSGGAHSPPPGGGEVALDGARSAESPYDRALGHIRERDFDSARGALLEALQSPSAGREGEVRAKLAETERELLGRPATAPDVLLRRNDLLDTRVSVRGAFVSGGEVGAASQYFWVEAGKRLRCRYGKLSSRDKAVVSSLRAKDPVLVRGTLRPPWGTDGEPYLETEFVHAEKAR
ncbi:MAG: hypothetical protein WC969_02545 [Elusimicrobiota bacterium]|jgi:hypothetical protein